ncbi:hypothetical protein JW859_01250 [bacterium]|nr:hypothetical protein [bacterium]
MRAIWLVALLPLVLLPACQAADQLLDNQPADTMEASPALAEIDRLATPAGVDPTVFDELKTELKRVISEYHGGKLPAQSPPTAEDVLPVVTLGEDNLMYWYLNNPGDYNQDGIVGVSDLTPLGQHFLEAGPFAEDSAAFVVDGNGDGLINVSDITPIGQNFNNTITSYTVYASADIEDHPRITSAKTTSEAAAVGTVNVADFTAAPNTRKALSFDCSAHLQEYRWVVPSNGTDEGTASDALSGYWQTTDILPEGQQGSRAFAFFAQNLLTVTYLNPVDYNIMMTQATDETATTWTTPVNISESAVDYDTFPTGIATDNYLIITYFYRGDAIARQYTFSTSTWAPPVTFWENPANASSAIKQVAGQLTKFSKCQLGMIGDKIYVCLDYDNVIYYGMYGDLQPAYTGTNLSVPSLVSGGEHEAVISFWDDDSYRSMYIDYHDTEDALQFEDLLWDWPYEWHGQCLGQDMDGGYQMLVPLNNSQLALAWLSGHDMPQLLFDCQPDQIQNVEFIPGYASFMPASVVFVQHAGQVSMLTLMPTGESGEHTFALSPQQQLLASYDPGHEVLTFSVAYKFNHLGTKVQLAPVLSTVDENEMERILNPGLFQFGVRVSF